MGRYSLHPYNSPYINYETYHGYRACDKFEVGSLFGCYGHRSRGDFHEGGGFSIGNLFKGFGIGAGMAAVNRLTGGLIGGVMNMFNFGGFGFGFGGCFGGFGGNMFDYNWMNILSSFPGAGMFCSYGAGGGYGNYGSGLLSGLFGSKKKKSKAAKPKTTQSGTPVQENAGNAKDASATKDASAAKDAKGSEKTEKVTELREVTITGKKIKPLGNVDNVNGIDDLNNALPEGGYSALSDEDKQKYKNKLESLIAEMDDNSKGLDFIKKIPKEIRQEYYNQAGYTNYDGETVINKDNMNHAIDYEGQPEDITEYISTYPERGINPTEITLKTKKSKVQVTYTRVNKLDSGEYIYESNSDHQLYMLQKKGGKFDLVQYNFMKGWNIPDVRA